MFNLSTVKNIYGTGPANTSGEDLVKETEEGRMTLIDVRDQMEVASSGKAKCAVHIPLMMLQYAADPRHPEFHPDLDPTKPVALYCASGARSGMAQRMMNGLGYEQVHNVGGLGDWMRAGGEITR